MPDIFDELKEQERQPSKRDIFDELGKEEKKQPEISAEKGIPQYLIPFSNKPIYVKPGSFLGNLLSIPHAFFEAGVGAFESPYYILKGLGKILQLPSLEKAGEWGIRGLEPTRRYHELMRKQLYVPPTSPMARLAHSISEKVSKAMGSFASPTLPILAVSPTAYGALSGLETLGAGATPTQALTAGVSGAVAGKTFEYGRGLSPLQIFPRAMAIGATPEVARGLITGKPEQIGKGIEEGLSLGIFSALATPKTPLAREIYRNKVKAGIPREEALQTASLVEETINSLDIDKAKSLPLKEKEIQKVEKVIKEISKQVEDLPEVIKGKRGYKTEKGAKIGLRLFAKENKLPKDMDLTQYYNLEKDETGNFVWRKITEKPMEVKPEIKPKEEIKPPEVEIPKEEKPPTKEAKEEIKEKAKPTKEAKPYEGVEPGSAEWMKIWKEHPELQKEMAEIRQKQIIEEGKKEEVLPETKVEIKPETKIKGIPKELEPLAKEAIKYKNAEEFVDNFLKNKFNEEIRVRKVGNYYKIERISEGKVWPIYNKIKKSELEKYSKDAKALVFFDNIKKLFDVEKRPKETVLKIKNFDDLQDFYNQAVKEIKKPKQPPKEKPPVVPLTKTLYENSYPIELSKASEEFPEHRLGVDYVVKLVDKNTGKVTWASLSKKRAKELFPRSFEEKGKEIPKAEAEWQPVKDYSKEITEGTHVKWRYRGREGEGIATGKIGKRKTGFVYHRVKTPEGKTKYMPWTSRAEYWIKAEKEVKEVKPLLKKGLTKPKEIKPTEPIKEVKGVKGKYYRSFENPEEAIGSDVSYQKDTPFLWEGAYEIEFEGGKGKEIPHHPGALRGDITNAKVTKVFYEPEYWAKEVREQRIKEDLAKLKKMFPEAEFIRVKTNPKDPNLPKIVISEKKPVKEVKAEIKEKEPTITQPKENLYEVRHPEKKTWYQVKKDPETEQWRVIKFEPYETTYEGKKVTVNKATETKFFKTLEEAKEFAQKGIIEKKPEVKLYSGIPVDEIVKTVNETTKKVVDYIKQKKIEKIDKAEIEHTDRFLSFYAKQIPKVLTKLYEKEHLKTAHPETIYREALGELSTTMPDKVKKPIVDALDASREHDYKLSGYEIKVKEKLLGSYNAIYNKYGKKGIKRFFDLLSAEAHKRHAISEKQLKELPPEFQLAYKRTKEYLLSPLKEYMKFLKEKYPESKEYYKVRELLKQAEKDYFYQPTVRTHKDIILVLKKPKKESAKPTVVGAFEFPNERKAKQQYNRMLKGDYTAILNWFRRVGDLENGREFVNNIKKGNYTLKLIKFKTEPTYTPEDIPLQSVMGILSKYKGKQIRAKNLQAKAIAEDIQRFIEKFVNPISVKSFHLEKKNIPGWSLDPIDRNDILLRRVLSEKSLIEKLKLSDVITNSFAQIDPEEHPQYYKWLSDFNKYMMTPREPETARRILSAWSMWGNAMSVIANAFQTYIMGPAIMIENKLNPAKFLKYEAEYLRKFIESDYDSKDLAYLEWGKKNGVFAPTAWKEGMLGLMGERKGIIPKIEDIGYAGFTFVESVKNRMNTFLAVAKMLEEKGMPFEEAMKKARDITFDIHFDMNKWNTLIRGKYPRLAQSLMSFTFHSFKTLRRLIFKSFPSAKERKYAIGALATFYLTHFLVGGMAATPGGELFWQMIDIPFKKVFRQSIKTYLMNEFSDKERRELRLFIQYGLLGLAGLPSVADRIGFGYREVSKLNNFIADAMAHLAPIPVMIANQAVKAIRMTQKGYSWPTAISQQFSPTVVRNISRTLYAIKKGYLPTSYGKPLQDIYGNNFVPTGLEEIAMSFIGAIPPEQQEIYEIKEAQRKQEDIRLAHLHDITNDIVLGYLNKDYARIGRGFAKWTKYNKEIIKKIIKAKKEKRNDLARFWSTQLIEQKAVETSIRNRLGRHESAPNLLTMSWWKKGQKGYEEAVKVILLREYLRRLKQRLRR